MNESDIQVLEALRQFNINEPWLVHNPSGASFRVEGNKLIPLCVASMPADQLEFVANAAAIALHWHRRRDRLVGPYTWRTL